MEHYNFVQVCWWITRVANRQWKIAGAYDIL